MHMILLFIIISVTLENCLAFRSKGLKFRNLYDYVDDETSKKELFDQCVKGIDKFTSENSKFIQMEKKDITPSENTEYDFIVVGGKLIL